MENVRVNVFISWSGPLARDVAKELRDWLPLVLQGVEVFMSEQDIDSGARWFDVIGKHLEQTHYGIIVVSRANQQQAWLMFEVGALSKKVTEARVVPLLVDLPPTDLVGPLAQFQAREITEADIARLVRDINELRDEARLSSDQLDRTLPRWLPDLLHSLAAIRKEHGQSDGPLPTKRSQQEILSDVLTSIRNLERDFYEYTQRRPIPSSLQSTGLLGGSTVRGR